MDIKIQIGDTPLPIEKRLQGMKPLCDGLYPHEVLAIDYAPYCNSKEDNYVTYWEYQYGINNSELRKIFNSLLDRNYIELGTITDAINMATVPVIKEELKKRGLKVSGKKSDLVNRLISNVPEAEISTAFDKIPYRQTPLGKQIIEKYKWVLLIHKEFRGQIDMWEFAILMDKSPTTNYLEYIWEYLEQKCDEHLQHNDYGLYRNAILNLSNFAYKEGEYSKSFDYLCVVTAHDLSCTGNSFRFDIFNICLSCDSYFECEPNSSCRMGVYFVEKYRNFMNLFGWSENELKKNFVHNIANTELPIWLFTPEQYGEILLAEIHEDEALVRRLYKEAKKAFKKEHKAVFQEIKELDNYDLGFDIDFDTRTSGHP